MSTAKTAIKRGVRALEFGLLIGFLGLLVDILVPRLSEPDPVAALIPPLCYLVAVVFSIGGIIRILAAAGRMN